MKVGLFVIGIGIAIFSFFAFMAFCEKPYDFEILYAGLIGLFPMLIGVRHIIVKRNERLMEEYIESQPKIQLPQCPSCGQPMKTSARACPRCGDLPEQLTPGSAIPGSNQ